VPIAFCLDFLSRRVGNDEKPEGLKANIRSSTSLMNRDASNQRFASRFSCAPTASTA